MTGEARVKNLSGARYVLICGAGQFTGARKIEKMTTKGESNRIIEQFFRPIGFRKDCSSFRFFQSDTIDT